MFLFSALRLTSRSYLPSIANHRLNYPFGIIFTRRTFVSKKKKGTAQKSSELEECPADEHEKAEEKPQDALHHLTPEDLADCVDEKTNRKLQKLYRKQETFQACDGRPIFLKAGIRDVILFQLTNVLIVIGMVMSFIVFYQLAYDIHPERKEMEEKEKKDREENEEDKVSKRPDNADD